MINKFVIFERKIKLLFYFEMKRKQLINQL